MKAHTVNNKMLGRKEVVAEMKHASTPSMTEAQQHIAQETGVAPELVVVKSIRNQYGSRTFHVEAFAYDSPEHKTKFERAPKAKKEGAK